MWLLALLSAASTGLGAEGITWRAAERSVDADVRGWELPCLLELVPRHELGGIPARVESPVTVAFKQNSPKKR
jgi:hypothetical protein